MFQGRNEGREVRIERRETSSSNCTEIMETWKIAQALVLMQHVLSRNPKATASSKDLDSYSDPMTLLLERSNKL